MAISLNPLGDTQDIDQLKTALKNILTDLEDQLNQRANLYVSTDGRVPTALNKNDVIIVAYKGNISLFVKSSTKGYITLTAAMLGGLIANGCNFIGKISHAAPPAATDVPNNGDFAFYQDTVTPAFYLIANIESNFKKVAMT